MKPYIITIEGDKNEWQYNLKIMGETMIEGQRIEFISYNSDITELGSNLNAAPADFKPRGIIRFESKAAESLVLYIYGIPHSLPQSESVEEAISPELHVIISQDGEVLYNRRHLLNPWSGANIKIEL